MSETGVIPGIGNGIITVEVGGRRNPGIASTVCEATTGAQGSSSIQENMVVIAGTVRCSAGRRRNKGSEFEAGTSCLRAYMMIA